ncbi:MAG: tetratricopeptide repeat protein [Planctomycetaceae bacterium]|nr:tetratricopeptide repeat protein [Planctomycetaceae bacterium]
MRLPIRWLTAPLVTLVALSSQLASPVVAQVAPAAPNSAVEQLKTQAEDAYKRGDFDKSIQLADSALRRSPKDHVAIYLRGSARVEQGVQQRDAQMLRDGIADAREAISLGGRENVIYYLPYLYGMTNLSIVENRKEHAEISTQQADVALSNAALKPDEKAKLTYQRGLARGFLGLTDTSVKDFEDALRLDPQFLAAYTAAADTLARADRRDAAKAAFDRAVRAFPENPLVYNNRGMFLQQTNQPEKAVADLTRSLELDPNYFYAYTNRGVTLMLLDNPQAAENDFTASLRLNPEQPMVYGLRGTARVAAGKFDEAIADHRKALQMVPNHPTAVTDLGFAQFFAGRYEDAVRSFEKALELNPNFTQLQPWRIAALEELGRKDAAGAEFAASFDKPAASRDWIDNLVAFQYDRINSDQLRAAVAPEEPRRTAQNAEAEYFIGRKLAQQGQTAEANAAFQRVVKTGAKHLSAYRGAKFALAGR